MYPGVVSSSLLSSGLLSSDLLNSLFCVDLDGTLYGIGLGEMEVMTKIGGKANFIECNI